MAKKIVIRHNGNGKIRAEDINIEDVPSHWESFDETEDLCCVLTLGLGKKVARMVEQWEHDKYLRRVAKLM